jgi:hypothetical protein
VSSAVVSWPNARSKLASSVRKIQLSSSSAFGTGCPSRGGLTTIGMTCLLTPVACASSFAHGPESSESGEITNRNLSLLSMAAWISGRHRALNGTAS